LSIADRHSDSIDDAARAQRKLDARGHRTYCIDCIHSAMISQLNNTMLACRAHPPRLIPIPMQPNPGNPQGGMQFMSIYPAVEKDWTCGEGKSVEVANQ
jgi:hypothetical protein